MLGRHDNDANYDTVVGDDAAGTRSVMAHLFGLGHRRIAHLTIDEASTENRSAHGIRLRTYLEEMTLAGFANDIRVIRTGEGQAAGSAAIRAALDDDPTFTAVFGGHDELAIGALRAVAESSAHIAVAGYDDVPIASHPALGLTTVRQPGAEMGARAIELLLERMNGRDRAAHVAFTPELVVRTSTFPPG
jgi:LacI family transcriptional regulator